MTPEEGVIGLLILGFGLWAGTRAFRADPPRRPVATGRRTAVLWILLGVALLLGIAALLFLAALRDLGRALS